MQYYSDEASVTGLRSPDVAFSSVTVDGKYELQRDGQATAPERAFGPPDVATVILIDSDARPRWANQFRSGPRRTPRQLLRDPRPLAAWRVAVDHPDHMCIACMRCDSFG